MAGEKVVRPFRLLLVVSQKVPKQDVGIDRNQWLS